MGLVQNNASQDLRIISVWYAGSTTLSEGNVLCWDTSSTNAPLNSGLSASNPPNLSGGQNIERNLRGHRVIDVSSTATGSAGAANNPFAGLVAAQSSGVVGPAFIDLVVPEPGQVANVFMNSTTACSTLPGQIIGINNGVIAATGSGTGTNPGVDNSGVIYLSTGASTVGQISRFVFGICMVDNTSTETNSTAGAYPVRFI